MRSFLGFIDICGDAARLVSACLNIYRPPPLPKIDPDRLRITKRMLWRIHNVPEVIQLHKVVLLVLLKINQNFSEK